MRKRLRILWCVVGATVLYLGLALVGPALWSGPCGPGCSRRIKAFWVTPVGIFVEGFAYSAGQAENGRWELRASRIRLSPYWLSILRGKPYFRKLVLSGLAVDFTERLPAAPPGPRPPPPDFRADLTEITGARFTYRLRKENREGTLPFDQINLTAEDLSGEETERETTSTVNLDARFAESGRVGIHLRARFFAADPRVSLRIDLNDHDLSTANKFFGPTEQIRLYGTLRKAHSEFRWAKDQAHCSAALNFRGLAVKFDGGPERSGLSAALAEIGARAVLPEKNRGDFKPGYARVVRLPGEAPVAFVLRALKEAALKAASS